MSLCLAWLLGASLGLHAERLPIKTYSTADGLPHDQVNRIVTDSRGFQWFCTMAGLSRFDGYTFLSFGTEQGLPGGVNDFVETRAGEYWVATDEGLMRFNPNGQPTRASATPMFARVASAREEGRLANTARVLREGRDGTVWVGTGKGLFRVEAAGAERSLRAVDIGMPAERAEQQEIAAILEDRFGTLWVAAPDGLYRRWPDGSAARYTPRDGLPGTYFMNVYEDHEGGFWAATREAGFFGFTADASHAPPSIREAFSLKDGLPNVWISQVLETSDGRFWLGSAGLVEFFPHGDARGRRFHTYTERNGLSNLIVNSISEDRAGNLWLASRGGGAMKLAHDGFTTYGRTDGIFSLHAIVEDSAGTLCFRGYVWVDLGQGELSLVTRVGCFDGQRFEWFEPVSVSDGRYRDDWGWVLEGITLRTRRNEFWIGTGQGVYRFAPADHFLDLKTARPRAIYTTSDGLAGSQVRQLFEDSGGNVWISTTSSQLNGLARWDARTERVIDLGRSPGLPSFKDDLPRSFGEDASGVWLGFYGGLARYAGGSFTFFSARDGLPPGTILDIHRDRAGRLWLASDQAGLIRVDHTEAARPTFVRYTTAEGLSSNDIEVIVEDGRGFLYVGGGRGLDRFDPATSQVKHFTAADGLAPTVLRAAYRDRQGVLWFGTTNGLARYAPVVDAPPIPPEPLISALRVSGVSQPVSALGEHALSLQDLGAQQNHLEIDFVALAFGAGEVMRYQYKLDGAGADWSAPSELRTVNYASLAPGRYTFLVRAVSSDGLSSAQPASIAFTILRPVWLRWWFLTMAALAGSAVLYSVYRYRVARILEMAALRTRIATDLHDDIGANLTRIALLSDVAELSPDAAPLASIGRIARESVGAMGDIVWAINPKRESLADLIRRMRQHADEVFTLRDIALQFNTTVPDHEVKLGVDVRRDVLLIFKEAVNNVARHSRCSRVAIDLRLEGSRLVLAVEDNGVGFDASKPHEGHGLPSLLRRAERLHGSLDIVSRAGSGTTLTLTVPTSLRS